MDDGDAMTPGSGNGGAVKYPLPERELIVVADAEVAMRAGDRLVRSAAGRTSAISTLYSRART